MFRYAVPVDDQVHAIELTGRPAYVANGRALDEVEFWAEHDDQRLAAEWRFRVFGTGYQLPEKAVYIGTAPRTREGLVRHLYALTH